MHANDWLARPLAYTVERKYWLRLPCRSTRAIAIGSHRRCANQGSHRRCANQGSHRRCANQGSHRRCANQGSHRSCANQGAHQKFTARIQAGLKRFDSLKVKPFASWPEPLDPLVELTTEVAAGGRTPARGGHVNPTVSSPPRRRVSGQVRSWMKGQRKIPSSVSEFQRSFWGGAGPGRRLSDDDGWGGANRQQ
jgi:hypothetical protein